MTSILTNSGAINALQALRMTNKNLSMTQNQISTGKTIASAKDSASLWSIAKVMETDKEAFESINKSLGVTGEIVATARTGAERIVDILKEAMNLAVNGETDGFDFATIDKEIKAKLQQIDAIISGTQANGVNLLSTNGISGGTEYRAIASLDRGGDDNDSVANPVGEASAPADGGGTPPAGGGTPPADGGTPAAGETPKEGEFKNSGHNVIVINSLDFQKVFADTTVEDVTNAEEGKAAYKTLQKLHDTVVKGTAVLGVVGKRIADQNEFIGKLADSLEQGIGSIVDADMEEASARLQALQAQQQLGIQALSIANQAPQSILSLFR